LPPNRCTAPIGALQRRTALAAIVSKTGASDDPQDFRSRCLLLQRLGELLFQFGVGQREFSPSFRSNEDLGFGSSPLCETRSPRRHSHWSPSGRAVVSLRTRRESSAASVRSIRSFARTLALLIRQRWPFRGAASHGSMVMWQASRRDINTRIDQHLDLVTTILARPEMTDFVLAHVLRPLRRNHQLITRAARLNAWSL
jgi:hypothetical protein